MQSISFQPPFDRFQNILCKMDASQHTRIDSGSSMSISETHSEKTASDIEEDFKPNIPSYIDETTEREEDAIDAVTPTCSSYGEFLEHKIEALDDDDDNPNIYSNYATRWDLYEGCLDEGVGSDYSAYSAGECNQNFYIPMNAAARTPTTAAAYRHYESIAMQEIRHSPNSMVLRPPSSSTLNYHYPPHTQPPLPPPPTATSSSSSSSHVRNLQAPTTTTSPHAANTQQSHLHAQRGSEINGSGYQQRQPTSAYNHPNMWHPNAPYGTGGGAYYSGPHGPQRYGNCNAGYAIDPVMDMLQLSNSGREARNRAEKNRRDKLNGSIQELSTMVPHVTESPRRVDKTAVLRFAAHGLRLQYVFGEAVNERPMQITDPLMKLLDSFFITVTCHGQIVLISSSIEQHLGHCQADLYGQSLQHITHPEDHNMLKQQLIPKGLENLFDIQPDDESGEPRPRTQLEEEYIDKKLREDRRSFTIRLARAGPRSEPTAYEVVKLDGSFRRSDAAPRGLKTSTFPSTLQLIRRTRGRDDAIPLHTISGNDIVMIAIARIIRPPKIINRVLEANTMEYKTRHLIDGCIVDCDQRIGLVAGYMTDEVRNLSPFTFMHQDDVRWVIVALRQMYDSNRSCGESTYRLLTRNGNFIYLTSKGYLEIDKDTNKVHSFVCVNTLLDETEGRRRIEEMKNKFSIIIQTKIPQSSVDMPASENPQQLEKAVLCLIQNLQHSPTYDADDNEDDDFENNNNDHYSANEKSYIKDRPATDARRLAYMMSPNRSVDLASSSMRITRTPPLALVPPEASSVKTSISKSVSVVNVTAAKHLMRNLNQQRNKSPMYVPAADSTTETILGEVVLKNDSGGCDTTCECCERSNSTSPTYIGIKRSASNVSSSCSENEDVLKPKQPKLSPANSASERAVVGTPYQPTVIEFHNSPDHYNSVLSSSMAESIADEQHPQPQSKSEYGAQMKDRNTIKENTNTTKTSKPRKNQDNNNINNNMSSNNNSNELKPR